MRRREFIGLASCATLACSLGVHAQEAGRLYRIALVTPVGRDEPATLAFLDELRAQGFVEGKNLAIVGGQPTANEQVATVVPMILQTAPDAIVTGGDVIARAFQKATQSIPIIVMTEDMVAGGFAASLARPGGNTTGISLMSPDLDGKRQDILIEAVPARGALLRSRTPMSQAWSTSRPWRRRRESTEKNWWSFVPQAPMILRRQ